MLRCRQQKKEKKEKKKKYLKIYKGVQELAKFNKKNVNDVKEEFGIKTNRHLVNIFDEEDYRRQESLRERTHHREEFERIFGEQPRPLEDADDKYEEELKKFERNQRRRINYAKQKQNMLALFAQDKKKEEREEIFREERPLIKKKKNEEMIADLKAYCADPNRWEKEKEKEEEEKKKKEKEMIDFFKKFNFLIEEKEKNKEENEEKPEKEEKIKEEEEPKDEEKPAPKEEAEEVEEEDDDEPTFKEENGEFVVLNNKKFFSKINKNQLFNQKNKKI